MYFATVVAIGATASLSLAAPLPMRKPGSGVYYPYPDNPPASYFPQNPIGPSIPTPAFQPPTFHSAPLPGPGAQVPALPNIPMFMQKNEAVVGGYSPLVLVPGPIPGVPVTLTDLVGSGDPEPQVKISGGNSAPAVSGTDAAQSKPVDGKPGCTIM